MDAAAPKLTKRQQFLAKIGEILDRAERDDYQGRLLFSATIQRGRVNDTQFSDVPPLRAF